jgi:hypothetical protein
LALVLGAGQGAAFADQLLMEDGRVLSGTVSRSGSTYQLINSNGTATDYPKSDVERWVDVAEVSPADALGMIHELNDLAMPVLTALEPDQFSFLTESSSFSSDREFESESVGAFANGRLRLGQRGRRGQRGSGLAIAAGFDANRFSARESQDADTVDTVRRDKGIDNVFIDEWARYTALFAALEQDPRYRTLTDRRRNSDSLADFARRPSEDFESSAAALREALIGLRECFDAASETQKRIRAIPVQAVNDEEDVQDLEIRLATARNDLDNAPFSNRLERRVRNLENRLRKRVSRVELDAQRNARIVERKINDFARKRRKAISHLQAVETLLTEDAQQSMTP